jgi:uncharacterized protein (TIGR02996 family)
MAKAKKPEADGDDLWTRQSVLAFAPDEASIPAAEKVLKKGGFGKVEASADGKGWWVVCRGLTDTYQVSLRIDEGIFTCNCTCPSPKYPCKHALALVIYLIDHPEERVEPEAPKHAATDFEALVRAVFQNPEEDTPRLVFADFLDENDQPDRAALIRLQCEKTRLPAKSDRAKELAVEEKVLLRRVRAAAVDPLPEGMQVEFRRGFIHLSANLFVFREIGGLPERFTRLFREGWVETFRAGEYSYDPLTEEHATLLGLVGELDYSRVLMMTEDLLVALVAHSAEMRATGRLCRVTVEKRHRKEFDQLSAAQAGEATAEPSGRMEEYRSYRGLTRQSFDLFLRAGRFRNARRLYLEGPLGDWGAEQLAAADLPGVEELFLGDWQIGPDGLNTLVSAPGLSGVTGLTVTWSELRPEHLRALAADPTPSNLENLTLNRANMRDDAAAELAKATRFRRLRRLDLGTNALNGKGAAELLRSPHFPALATLDLSQNDIYYPDLLPMLLAVADRPELTIQFDGVTLLRERDKNGLRVSIDITAQLRSDLFTALAPGAAKRVTRFSVSRAQATAAGLRAAARAFDPAALRELELYDMPLKNEGAEAFAEAFRNYTLQTLRLSTCRIQASGVAALAGSPVLDSVRVLDLTGNAIGKAGAAALAASEHLGNLERLELTADRVSAAEQKLLKAKFGKKLVM